MDDDQMLTDDLDDTSDATTKDTSLDEDLEFSDDEDDVVIDAEKEEKEEDGNYDTINARNTGDELVDENAWEGEEFKEAVEGDSDGGVPPGMHIVDDAKSFGDAEDDLEEESF